MEQDPSCCLLSGKAHRVSYLCYCTEVEAGPAFHLGPIHIMPSQKRAVHSSEIHTAFKLQSICDQQQVYNKLTPQTQCVCQHWIAWYFYTGCSAFLKVVHAVQFFPFKMNGLKAHHTKPCEECKVLLLSGNDMNQPLKVETL